MRNAIRNENLGQRWDHESRLLDTVLCRHHKSNMADSR